MHKAAKPRNEAARIDALHALNILDTEPEERFDRLTRLARRLFGVSAAVVSLVDEDRVWCKSLNGQIAPAAPREDSFCGHAILDTEVFVVSDTRLDERFCNHPAADGEAGVRFYAGYPLAVADGSRVGTLCLIDHKPRDFNARDMALLSDLARMAEQEFAAARVSTMDRLTTLTDRRGFQFLSQHALGMCKRSCKSAALSYFSLDLFRHINHRYGRGEGDRALTRFAHLFKEAFREFDVLARLGGDEFAALGTGVHPSEVTAAVSRMAHAVQESSRAAQPGHHLLYSMGTVWYDAARHVSVADLMADANARLYKDKQRRRAARDAGPACGDEVRAAA